MAGIAEACTAKTIKVSSTNSGGGLGSVGAYLRFENIGKADCSLAGWPSVIGVRSDGAKVHADDTSGVLTFPMVTGREIVVLAPHASAIAAYASGSNPTGSGPCADYVDLLVAPPASRIATSLGTFNAWYGHRLPACGHLEVTPVVPEAALDFIQPYRP